MMVTDHVTTASHMPVPEASPSHTSFRKGFPECYVWHGKSFTGTTKPKQQKCLFPRVIPVWRVHSTALRPPKFLSQEASKQTDTPTYQSSVRQSKKPGKTLSTDRRSVQWACGFCAETYLLLHIDRISSDGNIS